MKHILIAGVVAGAILGAAALGPAGGVAAVRHIAVNHSPAPPPGSMEIGSGTPAPAIVPAVQPSNAVCTGCPQNAPASCVGCPPQPNVVQLNLVRLPL